MKLFRLAIASIALYAYTPGFHAWAQETVLPQEVITRQKALPDSVVYAAVFHHALAFKKDAEELDLAGQDAHPFRAHMQHKLGLSPDQAISLDIAAEQFRLSVEPIEEEIAQSVLAFRKTYGVIADGQPTPPLPPEARYLFTKHDAAVIAVRDRFHALVGDSDFARIDALVKHRFSATGAIANDENTSGGK